MNFSSQLRTYDFTPGMRGAKVRRSGPYGLCIITAAIKQSCRERESVAAVRGREGIELIEMKSLDEVNAELKNVNVKRHKFKVSISK